MSNTCFIRGLLPQVKYPDLSFPDLVRQAVGHCEDLRQEDVEKATEANAKKAAKAAKAVSRKQAQAESSQKRAIDAAGPGPVRTHQSRPVDFVAQAPLMCLSARQGGPGSAPQDDVRNETQLDGGPGYLVWNMHEP
jgi:hypothetical protein